MARSFLWTNPHDPSGDDRLSSRGPARTRCPGRVEFSKREAGLAAPRIDDEASIESGQRRDAGVSHHQLEFASEELEDFLHAGLTERAEAPRVRPTDADGARAERQRLEDVRAAAEPTVDEHRDLALNRVDHLGHAFDRRAAAFLSAASMIGDDDAVDAMLQRERGVFTRFETLENEFHRRRIFESAHELPRQSGRKHGDAGEIETLEHRLAAKVARPARMVAGGALARVFPSEALLRFRVASRRKVDGEDEHGTA